MDALRPRLPFVALAVLGIALITAPVFVNYPAAIANAGELRAPSHQGAVEGRLNSRTAWRDRRILRPVRERGPKQNDAKQPRQ